MATAKIEFQLTDGTAVHETFTADSFLEGEANDHAEGLGNVEDWSICETDLDYDGQLDHDAFDDIAFWGDYCEQVEENGYSYIPRFEDIGENNWSEDHQGEWGSEEEFAEHLINECYEIPDFLVFYVDYEKWTSDIMMDYSSYDAEGCGVHIFRNN